MRSAVSMIALSVALAATCGHLGPAHAEDAVPWLEASLALGGGLQPALLEELRGGADNRLSEIRAVGAVSEVQVYDAATGQNVVRDGALAGATGLPMLIQNSGNGVLIQNAVILNVEVK